MKNNQEITKPILLKDLGYTKKEEWHKTKEHYGLYKCSCGKEFVCSKRHIDKNVTKSCGCYQKKRASETFKKHGASYSILYTAYRHMKERIFNPNNKRFSHYGGRGITICKEWLDDFLNFERWALDNGWKQGLSLDRIDVDGNYEPSNCRWTNTTVQNRNTQKLRKNNLSGYRGVSEVKRANGEYRYTSSITVNWKNISIGTFDTAIEAAKARDKYIIENELEHTLNFN